MDAVSASTLSNAELQMQIGNAVQRRAQDIQAQNAAQLVNSLPAVQPVPDPNATVGGRIDVYA
jgi:hypothetical protein